MPTQQTGLNSQSVYISTIVKQSNENKKEIDSIKSTNSGYSLTPDSVSGALGVGTTTPSARLDVKGVASTVGGGTVSIVTGSDVNQSDTVTLPADTAGDLNSDYWYLWSAKHAKLYIIWYNVNGAGANPYPVTAFAQGIGTPVVVAVPTGETATNVAIATAAAIDALPEFTVPVPTTPTLAIMHVATGYALPPINGNVVGWATASVAVGVSASDIIGTGTTFNTIFNAGDAIKIDDAQYTIVAVISATRVSLDSAATASVTDTQFSHDFNMLNVQTSDGSSVFTVNKSGRITYPLLVSESYVSDASAAIGGVPIGGLYRATTGHATVSENSVTVRLV